MPKTIEAIYENGVFKPLEKVNIPEHKKLRITLTNKAESKTRERCSLAGIIDIAKNCSDSDLSINHDKYLYGEGTD